MVAWLWKAKEITFHILVAHTMGSSVVFLRLLLRVVYTVLTSVDFIEGSFGPVLT
jgi:hypothetical protein